MTANTAAKLYTPEILALAIELAAYPYDPDAPIRSEVRSRSCGSTLAISLTIDEAGAITNVGMNVTACAIGQAAAAIFASAAHQANHREIQHYYAALMHWLTVGGPVPDWPRLELLDAARAYPGRHEAILLPWKAASAALCNVQTSG